MKKKAFIFATLAVLAATIIIYFLPKLKDDGMEILYPRPYYDIVKEEAKRFSLDENLIYAIMRAESKFDEEAESHAGAIGLMQLMPDTFEWILSKYPMEGSDGEAVNEMPDIYSPKDNIYAGAALLSFLLDYYASIEVALCGYNAGMGNVSQWLSSEEYSNNGETLHTIPFSETNAYVKKVKQNYAVYEDLYG
jgi:Soluble lytic murein transglycosylase and related regulatory proteins (some contain LysM/invasin domains)